MPESRKSQTDFMAALSSKKAQKHAILLMIAAPGRLSEMLPGTHLRTAALCRPETKEETRMKEVCAEQKKVVVLGHRGEHLARCIVFDIADWQTSYGEGAVQLLALRSGEETPYPCAVSVQDGMVRWDVRATDVARPGRGRVELQYHAGGAVVKSETYRTLTMEALGEAGPVPPDPEKDWVEAVLQAARDARQSAKDARDAVAQNITMGENGNWYINGKDTGVGAPGPRGERGPQGMQGESGLPAVVSLAGAEQALPLANNTDYRCMDAVTALTITGFEADPERKSEAWSIRFAAGNGITVTLPDTVVWNYGATPVFTPGSEYSLMFTPLLSGKVLGVWNEVEA